MRLALALVAFALAASAAGIDGHWSAQFVRVENAAAQPLEPFSIDLKTSGDAVTGTVALPGKKKSRFQKIENGTLDGGRLTFTTSQQGKKPVGFSWEATAQGDRLAGSRTRDGAKHGQKFTAQRN